MDVMKLVLDVYYTPIISTLQTENNKFYLIFEYPSNTIKLQMSLPDYRYGKSFSKIYLTDNIYTFIENLTQNINDELVLTDPFDLKFIINQNDIHVESENINFTIKNTESFRQQLIDATIEYYDFVYSYVPEW